MFKTDLGRLPINAISIYTCVGNFPTETKQEEE